MRTGVLFFVAANCGRALSRSRFLFNLSFLHRHVQWLYLRNGWWCQSQRSLIMYRHAEGVFESGVATHTDAVLLTNFQVYD